MPLNSPPERRGGKPEVTGPAVRTIAGRVLARGWAWPAEAKALAASALTQSPDNPAPPPADRHGLLKKGL